MADNLFPRRAAGVLAVTLLFCFSLAARAGGTGRMADFSQCVIVVPPGAGRVEQKAVTVLQEEIEKRTGIRPARTSGQPKDCKALIVVCLQSQLDRLDVSVPSDLKGIRIPGSEGFCLRVTSEPRPTAVVLGKDRRGVLFGVGRLLRKMHLGKGSILAPAELTIVTAPKYGLRGHQLGYRPKTNAYDAWSVAQYEQYIRELALFGTNSIELIPPRSDDDRTSRHMKVNALEMMIRSSEILDSYGLDVWIWYPNVGDDYVSDEGIKRELDERQEVFRKLKRIDALLIPGGDPGHLHPDVFFPWMDKVAVVLAKYHPKAKIWISPQAMNPTREWLASFYKYVNARPDWLGGVVFAPWIKTPIADMRRIVDNDIKIRRYPDITHNVACQYPVKDWDLAFALTCHRECFNPRPMAMKTIHNAFDEYACGSLTYSEGINDDINKFIWGDQDWDPTTEVIETLRDYCRLFISADFADELAQGFMAQERNWQGPLAGNEQVDVTLLQWQALENHVPQEVKNNYRFQMGLLRAYYDAYIRRRLIRETALEMSAMDALRAAPATGAMKAIDKASSILRKAQTEPVAVDYKAKCEKLADSLFELIGAQLTVEKHGAKHRTRGAFMDGIDEPLNNAAWLNSEFARIRSTDTEAARLAAIDAILNRTNPGPGGFYDNMGSAESLGRILNTVPWAEDPGTLRSPRIAFYYRVNREEDADIPLAWKNQACTIYETPLRVSYDNLDPDAQYVLRVAYTGRRGKTVQLAANDAYKVHDMIETRNPPVREFDIPHEATKDGHLVLTWTCGEGRRGSQVSELWLMRKNHK